MKYLVQVDGRAFEVEIEDLTARPVIAVVDGQAFEVWPQTERAGNTDLPRPLSAAGAPKATQPVARSAGSRTPPSGPAVQPDSSAGLKIVRAPIPGVITSVAVSPGDEVRVGGELCILEAMKMKNAIRATRAGQIAAVHILAGQHVKHNDPLMEYEG